VPWRGIGGDMQNDFQETIFHPRRIDEDAVRRYRECDGCDQCDAALDYEAEDGRSEFDPKMSAMVWRLYAACVVVAVCASSVIIWG
jgi:hypothetical protein